MKFPNSNDNFCNRVEKTPKKEENKDIKTEVEKTEEKTEESDTPSSTDTLTKVEDDSKEKNTDIISSENMDIDDKE